MYGHLECIISCSACICLLVPHFPLTLHCHHVGQPIANSLFLWLVWCCPLSNFHFFFLFAMEFTCTLEQHLLFSGWFAPLSSIMWLNTQGCILWLPLFGHHLSVTNDTMVSFEHSFQAKDHNDNEKLTAPFHIDTKHRTQPFRMTMLAMKKHQAKHKCIDKIQERTLFEEELTAPLHGWHSVLYCSLSYELTCIPVWDCTFLSIFGLALFFPLRASVVPRSASTDMQSHNQCPPHAPWEFIGIIYVPVCAPKNTTCSPSMLVPPSSGGHDHVQTHPWQHILCLHQISSMPQGPRSLGQCKCHLYQLPSEYQTPSPFEFHPNCAPSSRFAFHQWHQKNPVPHTPAVQLVQCHQLPQHLSQSSRQGNPAKPITQLQHSPTMASSTATTPTYLQLFQYPFAHNDKANELPDVPLRLHERDSDVSPLVVLHHWFCMLWWYWMWFTRPWGSQLLPLENK